MKLATYKDGSRDGQLLVVSRDLGSAHYATGIAHRLQQVLDDWDYLAPQLQDLYVQLNAGRAPHAFRFDPQQCMAPLPRAYQWVDGSAYLNHVELVRKARIATGFGAKLLQSTVCYHEFFTLQAALDELVGRGVVHSLQGVLLALLQPPRELFQRQWCGLVAHCFLAWQRCSAESLASVDAYWRQVP